MPLAVFYQHICTLACAIDAGWALWLWRSPGNGHRRTDSLLRYFVCSAVLNGVLLIAYPLLKPEPRPVAADGTKIELPESVKEQRRNLRMARGALYVFAQFGFALFLTIAVVDEAGGWITDSVYGKLVWGLFLLLGMRELVLQFMPGEAEAYSVFYPRIWGRIYALGIGVGSLVWLLPLVRLERWLLDRKPHPVLALLVGTAMIRGAAVTLPWGLRHGLLFTAAEVWWKGYWWVRYSEPPAEPAEQPEHSRPAPQATAIPRSAVPARIARPAIRRWVAVAVGLHRRLFRKARCAVRQRTKHDGGEAQHVG